jgi:hypothetical protein
VARKFSELRDKLPKQPLVLLDVDGCIIDHQDNFRPFIIPFLQRAHQLGYEIIVWSGGGDDYARRHISRLGPFYLDYVRSFKTKIGNCKPENFVGRQVFVIDDSESLIARWKSFGFGGYRMPTYDAYIMENDAEFVRAMQEMEEYAKE